MLPVIAAAPTCHYQNPITVREVEELVSLEFAFESNGVESKVADVTQFVLHSLAIDAQKHVGRPAPSANQDVVTIYVKQLVSFRSLLRADLADAELHADRLKR